MVFKILAFIVLLLFFRIAPLDAATVIVTGLAFWGASAIFPDHVHFDDMKTVIIAAALYFVVLWLVRAVIAALCAVTAAASIFALSIGGLLLSVLLFLVGFVAGGTVSILLLDKCMAGFAVSGIMAAFLLSLIPAVCSAAVTAAYNTGHCRPTVWADSGVLYGDFYHPSYGGYYTPTTFGSDRYTDEFLYPSESFFDSDFWNL